MLRSAKGADVCREAGKQLRSSWLGAKAHSRPVALCALPIVPATALRVLLKTGLFLLAGLTATHAGVAAHSEQAPNVAELIRKSVAANTADWRSQPQFSYREVDSRIKIDSAGQNSIEPRKTYEVLMIEGSPYNRLIAIGNEPLNRFQQQQEQIKLNREIRKRQSETQLERRLRLSKFEGERAEEHLLMQQMVNAFHFTYAGEQQMNGVDCYVLVAEPDPDYIPPVEKAKVLTGMKGRLWVDKAQYHWVKVQAEVTSPVQFGLFIARVKPGTQFELNQAPVGDVWLPKSFTESVNASVLGVYGWRSKVQEIYSDYHQDALSALNTH